MIIDEDSYVYYAADGTELLKTDVAIEYVAETLDGDKALYAVPTEDGVDYYVFAK